MCIRDRVSTGRDLIWAYHEDYGSSSWTKVLVSFEMEGYATSAWRANNNAIVQIFDSEQNLLITQEAGFQSPNSQNIMKGSVFFDDNSLNHATTSGLYTVSVTIGSLQGTDTFFFHADCIAYCDTNDPNIRALKQTAVTTTTTPTPVSYTHLTLPTIYSV